MIIIYKYYLFYSKQQETEDVSSWIQKNCPTCEVEKFNSEIVNDCRQKMYQDYDNFLLYSACITKNIMLLKDIENQVQIQLQNYRLFNDKTEETSNVNDVEVISFKFIKHLFVQT